MKKKWLRKLLNRLCIIPETLRLLRSFWNSALVFNSNIFVLTFVSSYEFLLLNVLLVNSQIDGQLGNNALKFEKEWLAVSICAWERGEWWEEGGISEWDGTEVCARLNMSTSWACQNNGM